MLLGFYIYRFYLKMERSREEHSLLRLYGYVSMLVSSILLLFEILLTTFFRKAHFYEKFKLDEEAFDIVLFIILFVLIMIYVHIRFFYNKKIDWYISKYENSLMNKYFRDVYLKLTPIILFIVSPLPTIFLFGGEMFSHPIKGLLTDFINTNFN